MATRTTTNKPKLITPILYAIGAGISWTISGYVEPRWGITIAYVVTFALLAGLLFSGLDYLTYTWSRRWGDFVSAKEAAYIERTREETAKLKALAVLNSDQIAVLGHYTSTIETIPGMNMKPIQHLVLVGRKIDFEFVEEFLAAGTATHLAPVRRWSEGSNKRLDAEALTAFWIANQFATPAQGNQPSVWIDRASGMEAIGIEE